MSLFIDSGADFSPSIEQRKQFYNCKANDLGVEWCSYNEWTNRSGVYRRLLTNRLHGKAHVHGMHALFYHVVKVNCDVITRSRLQLINTSIHTFFSKLHAFLADQRRRKARDG